MRILELRAENIKKLKAISLTIDPATNVVVVAGRNGQGKTSLLDAIWYALEGKSVIPAQPIRNGEDHASVVLDLGPYIITRTFTEKGSYLKMENKDGASFNSPQQMLDELVGKLSFDPLAFAKKPVREQREMLLKLLGVDLAPLEAERKAAYEERTLVGRELKQLEGQLAGITIESGEVPQMVDVAALAKRITEGKDAQMQQGVRLDGIKRHSDRIEVLKAEIALLHEDVKKMAMLSDAFTPVDTEALEKQLAEAENINTRVRTIEAYRKTSDAVAVKKTQYDELEKAVAAVDDKKRIMFAEAKMPIEGLSVNDDGVVYKDVPLEQSSAAEQLRVSLAIAMAANPQIRVIRILDGSLLDAGNMQVIEEMAKENNYQVWIERVDESGKVGIIIEDGEVKATE